MTAEPAPLRVVVVGAGAVGSLLGGTLAAAGADVVMLGRRAREGEEPAQLVIDGPDETRTVAVRRVHDPAAAGDPDLVILAVKAFDLDGALATAATWPATPLMTVQNGAGAEEAARAARTSPILAGSVTTAVEPARGGVRRLSTGGMGVAVVPGPGAEDPGVRSLATRLVATLSAAGLPARLFESSAAMKWSKLLANLVGNATSAILDMDPGDVYADRTGYHVERRQIHEMLRVMRAMGLRPVALPGAHITAFRLGLALPEALGRPFVARGVAGARGGKSPSLRLGVRGGGMGDAGGGSAGPTEVRWLNGAVAAAGERLGVPAPVNACLAALVDECATDPLRAAWFARRPDRLADALARWEGRP